MAELNDLYQSVILDHHRSPRNFRRMDAADAHAAGYNPLCGDQVEIWLRLDGDRIADASFQGQGCAISKASASLMTTVLKGKTRAEAEALFARFHDLVTGKVTPDDARQDLGKLAVFSGVSAYPVRVKCASLAWHALKQALEAGNGSRSPR
ncbi:MAG: Fe-S cluster assembly sulfur transfer protein SufU [Gemmatimonadota bacterium]